MDELGPGGQNREFSVDLNEALLFVFNHLEGVSNCNLCRFEMSVGLLSRGWKPTGCGVCWGCGGRFAARLWIEAGGYFAGNVGRELAALRGL